MSSSTRSSVPPPGTSAGSHGRLSGEQQVIWTLWLTYGAFYFCRTNISAAVPGLKAAVDAGGLGLSNEQVGWILASLKIAYGLGQLLTGQMAERFSPRRLLAIGMFCSAALNILFGFSTGAYFLLFVWATNGFCQSLGWPPCVRVMANWVPVLRRGHAVGIIGTGYQITLGLTYLIAGQSAEWLGWRGALYVPAVLLMLTGVFMLVFLREAPDSQTSDSPTPAASGSPAPRPASPPLTDALYWTLYNPSLWLMGLALGLLNACRYGFLDWGVAHLMETQKTGVGKAVLQFFVIAIGATAGSYLAGWATDRFFGSRRAPVICLLMLVLGIISLNYDMVVRVSAAGTMLLLIVVGFCIYGPQVLLVGTAPADLAHRNTSAAAAGFVNFLGYMGAATGDVVTGYYSAPEHGGWQFAIYIWSGWAFAGAVVTALLWNTTSQKITLLPRHVPRWAALVMLTVASLAVNRSEYPSGLLWAALASLAGMALSWRIRWSALPNLVLSPLCLWFVFQSDAATYNGAAWFRTTAMAMFGLSALAGLMVLVDRGDGERPV